MSPTRCPSCGRALPEHPGDAPVRCPACRTPFEAGTGGGLGPRWVLLPLWPWCAVVVFSVLTELARSHGFQFGPWVVPWVLLLPLLLNLAVSVADARACGRARAARSGRARLRAWRGAVHSALGFSWCWLVGLLALAETAGWGGRAWFGVGFAWGCMLLAPGVFLSGLAVTAGAWSDSRRAKSALRDAVAAYDTFATAYNACAVVVDVCVLVSAFGVGFSWAPSFFAGIIRDLAPVINFSQARAEDYFRVFVPALLLVVAALGAGALSTAAIVRWVAGGRLTESPGWRRLAGVLDRATLSLLPALAVLLTVAAGLLGILGPPSSRRPPAPRQGTVAVLVTAADVPAFVVVTPEMVTTRKLPEEKVPPGAFTRTDQAVGRSALQPLARGKPLVDSQLTDKRMALREAVARIPEGMYGYTIHHPAVEDPLHGGGNIDVLLTTQGAGGARTVTLLEGLKGIQFVQQRVGPGDRMEVASVTVLVTPRQAAALNRARGKGQLGIALR